MEEKAGSKEDGSRSGQVGLVSCSGFSSSWIPRVGAFRPYDPFQESPASSSKSKNIQNVSYSHLVTRLTKDIAKTFQICNPKFTYSEVLNPKRFLSNPSVGVLNDGCDNEDNDLILHVNSVLINMGSKQRYIVKDLLGHGTFGQVAKCWVSETDSFVAVKIIKNQPAYYQQALVEVSILSMLNKKFTADERRHIVRILDYFVHQHHLCISFELLGSNLYELIKMNQFRGLPLNIVRRFSMQILHALVIIKDAGIIHCDLKPENILVTTSIEPDIKVIDFGSACLEGRTVYSYIQSRYYRSPEVLLGYPYTTAIDMWSFGCIVAELFLGLPLFAGASEFDLLLRMVEILGGQPPDDLLRDAQHTNKFFKYFGSIYRLEDEDTCKGVFSSYRVLTAEEYEARECKKPVLGKRYFNYIKLEDIIANYPYRKNLPEEEISKEKLERLKLVDFLRGLFEFNPAKRWSPLQASSHPFITGEALTCPYMPFPETQRIPLVHTFKVDHHNPGGGHWLAAGLSPQVQNVSAWYAHNSPHFQVLALSHGTNYGSLGNHCSYSDNFAIGNSYGSYGDANSMHTYFSPVGPCGMNVQAQLGGSFLGTSPDARRRLQRSNGNMFGVSPSSNLGPMSLGASPSQFTPPGCQMLGSTGSPGKYGSPARGSIHGSPLGKAAALAQYNKKRTLGNPGTSTVQVHENTAQYWSGYHNEGIKNDVHAQVHAPCLHSTHQSSNYVNWRQQVSSGGGLSSGTSSNSYHNHPKHTAVNTTMAPSYSSEVSVEKHESSSSLPDPADWDPNYSDELLLQEDISEVNSLAFGVANGMRLGNLADSVNVVSGIARSSESVNQMFRGSNQRADKQLQSYSLVDNSSHFENDLNTAFGRSTHTQNSPSRFGQQPVNRYNNYVHSTSVHGLRTHQKGNPSHSNNNTADSHSSGNNMFNSTVAWGGRTGHPVATILPSSHSRKDYGRIS
ncbi:Serine/threonine-protein kinase AFC2 [Apostasia shenzhenica]|uniref:Serine/threonine-protein kinase AFC2 n=1 Tax=Apostasia shenzhenica TaxID=1088818 RepID=A0A2I0A9H0_9ASPA|nr:Serine/threonine-protein kinase AFC2 [Apostasia shenzhenica]